MHQRSGLYASVVCGLAIVAGCSNDPYPTARVSGVVKLNGEPLEDVRIGFIPISKTDSIGAGPQSFARTDSEGKFELRMGRKGKGAVIGSHKVWFRMFKTEPSGKILRQETLPRELNDITKIKFDVPKEGTDEANFELEVKKFVRPMGSRMLQDTFVEESR